MINKPDYETAALKAMQIIIDNKITETPITPLSLLLKQPGVRVLTFAGIASEIDMKRKDLIPKFGTNQDAATFTLANEIDGVRYVVAYNKRLPYIVICRAIARELGHIVLSHDGITRTKEARLSEAMCFAHHLLSPRPILHLLQSSGLPLTKNVLASTTGCSDECIDGIQDIPGVHIPPEVNRQVRDLFVRGIKEYIQFYKASAKVDNSPIVDFGTFMDNYEE